MPVEPTEIGDLKAKIRADALARRDALDPDMRARAARQFADDAASTFNRLLFPLEPGMAVSGFWPIRTEIDPRPLMRRLAEVGARLGLPCIESGALIFRLFAFGDRLQRVGFGLSQPPRDAEEVIPDLMLVPLAAFDRMGGRIGYGKGYYDGAIARLSAGGPPPLKLGLCFACQEVPEIPMEAHDQRLDAILTEEGLVLPRA